VAVAWR